MQVFCVGSSMDRCSSFFVGSSIGRSPPVFWSVDLSSVPVFATLLNIVFGLAHLWTLGRLVLISTLASLFSDLLWKGILFKILMNVQQKEKVRFSLGRTSVSIFCLSSLGLHLLL